MSIRDTFSHGKKVSRDSMSKDYRKDRTFREVIKDSKIKRILDRPEEQRELHNMMLEKAADGSLSGDDMRVIFDDLAHKGKGKSISSEEGRQVASQVFTDSSRRYLSSKGTPAKKAPPTPLRPRYKSDRINMASPTGQATKLPPAFFASRLKSADSSANSNDTKKRTSFFNSMRSVMRHKQSK